MKLFEFGQTIPSLHIDGVAAPYPVINERVARASAGMLFVGAFFSFMQALYVNDRSYLSFFVLLFLLEFAIRVIVNPRLAPVYAVAEFVVRPQKPEWVGAIQKRFAWSLGLGMAGVMTLLVWVIGYQGSVTFWMCIVCLGLLWLESACGICVGCKIYHGLIRVGVIARPVVAPACPGGVCSVKKRK
jgi:hypothetical protein